MPPTSILRFDHVNLTAQPPYAHDLADVSLDLLAGEMGLVLIQPHTEGLPLVDLAEGLIAPDTGMVQFEGEDWLERHPDDAAAARGRIGRFFEKHSWISNLDVDENITLAERHHTTRPLAEIEAETLDLARPFGFTDLPRVRPAMLRNNDLRRAGWVRALIGAPALIMLEHSLHDSAADEVAALLAALKAARQRGAAVLWIVDSFQNFENYRTDFSKVWKLEGARLAAAKE